MSRLRGIFYYAIEIKLIWKPFQENVFLTELDDANRLNKKLFTALKEYTYKNLLAVFYDLYFFNKKFASTAEVESYIVTLKQNRFTRTLTTDELEDCGDNKKKELFKKLQELSINILRNNVVHKVGYRPNINEVNKAINQVSEVIYSLELMFDIEPSVRSSL